MSGGDIVGLVFAAAFLGLVGFLAVPLFKLGRVFDETTLAIRDLTHSATPLLEESTKTIQETNAQLARVDTITSNVADVTGNVSALVALVAATVGGPLVKLAGFSAGVRAALGGAHPGGTRRRLR
ncbi:DUF948 domain-containing protein [Cryobacterium sp. TMT3-29-2]|uniref:DUF948 domain-containing protein n=1 Tax=Cryobacterium sp. TMT3-29-2 TaxID=2555867 RepID=UPI001073E268|nr:DUF948 domain-containing protein [Cryobacterium sp. TMT3-29-2]TFC87852.1 DUF948 domain-containing protein [Cryobacterium sp. TMT3-29-2]